ncbi:unnamed protein product [Rotaria sp. Silwood1]|nr:unnamed protein product [Rotaria sp. Silwood1]CAF1613899.1 unnamed protein product [Rotaria sp. Silwood1]CAF3691573.1 unnamed protein product [Rotaria sp. Silwood1]CAF3740540.1 unnamed protein product [Rotaria sp. Silwood1]CAF3751831.1 unnamed protein product [Rotaria sp. Silwood1]
MSWNCNDTQNITAFDIPMGSNRTQIFLAHGELTLLELKNHINYISDKYSDNETTFTLLPTTHTKCHDTIDTYIIIVLIAVLIISIVFNITLFLWKKGKICCEGNTKKSSSSTSIIRHTDGTQYEEVLLSAALSEMGSNSM